MAAALANGATAYLKRIGLLDRPAFNEYVSIYCEPAKTPCACMRDPEAAHNGSADSDNAKEAATSNLPSRRYVYEVHGLERALKPIKRALFAAFLAVSLGMIATRRTAMPHAKKLLPLLPVLPLATSLALGLAIALLSWGPAMCRGAALLVGFMHRFFGQRVNNVFIYLHENIVIAIVFTRLGVFSWLGFDQWLSTLNSAAVIPANRAVAAVAAIGGYVVCISIFAAIQLRRRSLREIRATFTRMAP